MKRKYKYIPLIAIVVFLSYHSCYFERLDSAKEREENKAFDHAEYAQGFWNNKLMKSLDRAVDAKVLLGLLKTDMGRAHEQYGRTLGIGSNYYYLLGGVGKVVSIGEDGVFISMETPESHPDIIIATRYIYGNAVRNASGLVNVDEFPSSRDFNTISEEINKIVTTRVLPPFLKGAGEGSIVKFVGAAEIKKDEPDIHPLRVIPVFVQIQ